MAKLLRLAGIEAKGRHGASTGERDLAQPFTVDLEVVVDPASDDLAATADYREIVATAREVVEDRSHTLLETIAGEVAEAVARLPHVVNCRALVRKRKAAERLGLSEVSAEAVAGRPVT